MVLIGLISIAVLLMALGVPEMPGIHRKLPAPMPAAGRTGQRPDTEA